MKIMTFNVQHFLDYQNGVIDVDFFASAIKKHSPDFCGLNEVRGEGDIEEYTDQTNAIADATGYNSFFAEAILVGGTCPYGNAFICKHPIKNAEKIMIPDPEEETEDTYYETRCIAKSVIEIEGKEICFLVTHMGLACDERKNAVDALCRIIDETDLPVILMGDFNTTPNDEVLIPLFDRLENVDAYAEENNLPTFPSDNPEIKIDYILFKGLECIKSETVNEIYSDHLPIIAEFN